MTWQVMEGGCEAILPSLPSEAYQMVHLDPPYFPAATAKWQAEAETLRFYSKKQPKGKIFSHLDWDSITRELERVLAPQGALCLWGMQFHLTKLYLEHFARRFSFHREIIWVKKATSLVVNWKGPLPRHENLWILQKPKVRGKGINLRRTALQTPKMGPPAQGGMHIRHQTYRPPGIREPTYRPDHRNRIVHFMPSAIITESIHGGNPEYLGHPTQKSLQFTRLLVSLVTAPGDQILDPMCGSGTALLAGEMLGRNSIGIDINSRFVKMAKERLEAYDGRPS